jgi:phosphotransferase system  glucose/maltose/N-acetylglucosamine-specific IIC component
MAGLIYGLLSLMIILILSIICIVGLCNYRNWTDNEMKTFLAVFIFTMINSILLITGHLL